VNRTRTVWTALVATVATVLLAACSGGAYEATPVPGATTPGTGSGSVPGATPGTPTTTPSAAQCSGPEDYLRSYPPDPKASGGRLTVIRERGRLIAGVSADTLLFGARNPVSGNFQGFDIDRLHAISKALFGDPNRIDFKVITTAQRIPALQENDVDIVARTMSITCDRWAQVAFSGQYYEAGQQVLVPRQSAAEKIEDLDGKRVCAPAGSTSLLKLKDYPQVKPVPADTHTGCLALFQQGRVDAITGDDTVLAGLAAQDPYAKVVGEKFSSEPYGLAMKKGEKPLVAFVNSVLEKEKSDGAWQASYDRWLLGALDEPARPPRAILDRP
jgi:polar amino acid transport system substrate-binding protein